MENDDHKIEEVFVTETPSHLDCIDLEAKNSDEDENSDPQQEIRIAENPRKRKAANDLSQLYVVEAISGRRVRSGEVRIRMHFSVQNFKWKLLLGGIFNKMGRLFQRVLGARIKLG